MPNKNEIGAEDALSMIEGYIYRLGCIAHLARNYHDSDDCVLNPLALLLDDIGEGLEEALDVLISNLETQKTEQEALDFVISKLETQKTEIEKQKKQEGDKS